MNQIEHPRTHDSGEEVTSGVQEEWDRPGDIEVTELLRVIWRRKVWIAAATSLVTLAAIGYALIATEWYRAEAVLMPREIRSSGGLSAQLGQLGGLVDIAGLSLGQGSKQEPLGVLRSVGFARRFVERNELVAPLSEQGFHLLAEERVSPDRKLQRAIESFRTSVLSVFEDKKTGLITVAIEWKDPVVAASWANAIHRQLNMEMRKRALDEGARNVQYLQEQLERTEVVALQQSIARLIESEMQKLMLAEGTDEYALRVIDDAWPPLKRSKPKRTVLIIVAFMGGLFASLLVAVLFDPLKALFREVGSS